MQDNIHKVDIPSGDIFERMLVAITPGCNDTVTMPFEPSFSAKDTA